MKCSMCNKEHHSVIPCDEFNYLEQLAAKDLKIKKLTELVALLKERQ